jgi:hypothetical protein
MNDETTNLDQIDEDVLNPTVSDEALEAAGYGAPCIGPTEGCPINTNPGYPGCWTPPPGTIGDRYGC